MTQIMYNVPEMKDLREVLITKEVVKNNEPPVYNFGKTDKELTA